MSFLEFERTREGHHQSESNKNIGTVSKAALRKLPRDGGAHNYTGFCSHIVIMT